MGSIYSNKLLIIIFLLTFFSLTVFKNDDKNILAKVNHVNYEETVQNIINENSLEYDVASRNDNQKFVNLLLVNKTDTNIHKSYFVNEQTGKEVNFSSILKSNKVDDFMAKMYELLSLKYPKFIVDAIKTQDGQIAFELKENEMIIYYSNYVIQPEIQEPLKLTINYNEIKDYLDFTFKLDSDYTNESGYDYQKNKKTVALTFDDGPSSTLTVGILQALQDNKMHATFFMVGKNVKNYPYVVKQVYNSGNEIGSHSLQHANLKKMQVEQFTNDLNTANAYYEEVTSDNFKLLRPPYGAVSDEMLANIDIPFILWSVDPEDWKYRDCDTVVNNVMSKVKDGDIILLHDIHKSTAEAVNKLLPLLYANGYQVVSVSELAALKNVSLVAHQKYRRII